MKRTTAPPGELRWRRRIVRPRLRTSTRRWAPGLRAWAGPVPPGPAPRAALALALLGDFLLELLDLGGDLLVLLLALVAAQVGGAGGVRRGHRGGQGAGALVEPAGDALGHGHAEQREADHGEEHQEGEADQGDDQEEQREGDAVVLRGRAAGEPAALLADDLDRQRAGREVVPALHLRVSVVGRHGRLRRGSWVVVARPGGRGRVVGVLRVLALVGDFLLQLLDLGRDLLVLLLALVAAEVGGAGGVRRGHRGGQGAGLPWRRGR